MATVTEVSNSDVEITVDSTQVEITVEAAGARGPQGPSGPVGPPGQTIGPAGGDLAGTYPNPQIANGVVVDGDIHASAAIQQSKILNLVADLASKVAGATTVTAGNGLTGGGSLTANRTLDVGPGNGIVVNPDSIQVDTAVVQARSEKAAANGYASLDAGIKVPFSQVPTGTSGTTVAIGNHNHDTVYLSLSGGTVTGPIVLPSDPSLPLQAATKQYVDLAQQGFTFKNAARTVTTINYTLSAVQIVDGITLTIGDRVLVTAQSATSQNGIWIVQSGAWTRAPDADASGEIKDGTVVPIAEGGANADSQWICTGTSTTPWIVGSASTWTRWSSLGELVAGNGLTKTGTTINFVTGDSTLTVAADTVTVNTAAIEAVSRKGVANGYASLDGTTKVPIAQMPTGTTSITVALGNHNHSATYVPLIRTLLAGSGLTGGGDLTSDRSFDVGAGTGIVVQTDAVALDTTYTDTRYLNTSGDTATGPIVLAADPTAPLQASTKQYVDTKVAAASAAYSADLSSGTTVPVTHNLGTKDVDVSVYRKSDGVEVDVPFTRTSTSTISLNSVVDLAGHRVVVLAAGGVFTTVVLPSRTTAAVTTASLSPNTHHTGTIALTKSYRLMKLTTDRPARVRLYATAAQRDADVTRSISDPPNINTDHGVLFDAYTDSSLLSFFLTPVVEGFDGKSVPDGVVPFTVTNRDSVTANVTVTFLYVQTEG